MNPDDEERYDRHAKSQPLTGYEPNELSDAEITPSPYQSSSVASSYDLGEEHCGSPSGPGDGRWANKGHAGFTTVLTGERSKCRPATSLSLLWSKLCVKLSTNPSEYGETRCSVFTQEKIESRVAHQTEMTGTWPYEQSKEKMKYCLNSLHRKTNKNTSWGAKRPVALRGNIWNKEAGVQSTVRR